MESQRVETIISKIVAQPGKIPGQGRTQKTKRLPGTVPGSPFRASLQKKGCLDISRERAKTGALFEKSFYRMYPAG
jgi:hypothetical protein